MKILIIDTRPPAKTNDSSVCTRNAAIIRNELSKKHTCHLVARAEDLRPFQYDLVIFNYASFYFDHAPFMRFVDQQKNARIGWITNEYNLSPNSCFYDRIDFVLANFDQEGCRVKNFKAFANINLNTLVARERNASIEKKFEAIYYGTFRPGRADYLTKYVHDPMYLSTSKKNFKKYKEIGCKPLFIDKLSWAPRAETLNLFKASLYIEDTTTHWLFNNLANRFYEALTCNAALFFDRSCRNTIMKSGYPIDEYFVVNSREELFEKISKIDQEKVETFLKENSAHAMNERKKVLSDIVSFVEAQ